MPGLHAAAIHLFSSSYYPMPIHSIQMLIAFVKTTDTSPLQIPSIISKIPKNARAGPIHLDSVIFRIIFSLSVMIIFYFETFLSSFPRFPSIRPVYGFLYRYRLQCFHLCQQKMFQEMRKSPADGRSS